MVRSVGRWWSAGIGSSRWKTWRVASDVVYAAINQVGPRITGMLVALNAKDGALRWCVPLNSEGSDTFSGRWHVFAADEQAVYVVETAAHVLLALNTSAGALRWFKV